MKKTFIFFLLLWGLTGQSRQVYTIRSGNWEADSVWFNSLKPDTTGDTISVYHHIQLHSDIVLSTGSYLFIDSTGWLCGDHSLLMTNWSYLFNLGFLGLYYFEIYFARALNLAPGVVYIGEQGMYVHGIGSWFKDSLGCMKVHEGKQQCLFPCVLDTSFSVIANYSTLNFSTLVQPVIYDYDFGDGTTLQTTEHQLTHTYSQSGDFTIRLIIYNCCGRDTVYRQIHVELPPPPCADSTWFLLYPNPAIGGFWITKEFCDEEDIQVKIFTAAGQLTSTYSFKTVEKLLKEYISCFFLSPATYIVDIQSPTKSQKLKLVLVDDY